MCASCDTKNLAVFNLVSLRNKTWHSSGLREFSVGFLVRLTALSYFPPNIYLLYIALLYLNLFILEVGKYRRFFSGGIGYQRSIGIGIVLCTIPVSIAGGQYGNR